jgi:hypothetical protein
VATTADQEAVVPFDVNTNPFVPIPSLVALFVPFPIIKSPVVVIGLKALNAVDAVVCPVPPLAIATVPVTLAAVPEVLTLIVLGKLKVTASVDAEAVICDAVPVIDVTPVLAIVIAVEPL